MQKSPLIPSKLYGRQVVRRIFPILGTCVLIYWLEGGIPPAPVSQFIQISTHLNTLWASNELNTLVSLLLLIAQILCVILAWICLLWLMVREFQALLSGNVSQQNINRMHAHQASATPPFFQVEGPTLAPFLPPTNTSSWPNAQSQHTTTPFDSQDSGALDPYDPNRQATAGFTPTRPQTQNDPTTGRAVQKTSIATNTFTSSSASSNIPIPGSRPSAETDLTEEGEEDDPFTFGDPFAGPLPDVFHHDQSVLAKKPSQSLCDLTLVSSSISNHILSYDLPEKRLERT